MTFTPLGRLSSYVHLLTRLPERIPQNDEREPQRHGHHQSTGGGRLFAIIANPASHAAIDGTGWVRDSPDPQPLTESGQVFRMAMYHPNHPNGNYEMANQVQVIRRRPSPGNLVTTRATAFSASVAGYGATT
jgi:hypothetical protein